MSQGINGKKQNKKTRNWNTSDFISKNKHKKNVPLSKCDHFFQKLCVQFEPLLGWESAFICHDLRTEKEGIYVKRQENKRNN